VTRGAQPPLQRRANVRGPLQAATISSASTSHAGLAERLSASTAPLSAVKAHQRARSGPVRHTRSRHEKNATPPAISVLLPLSVAPQNSAIGVIASSRPSSDSSGLTASYSAKTAIASNANALSASAARPRRSAAGAELAARTSTAGKRYGSGW
jgi:hypothetical protein